VLDRGSIRVRERVEVERNDAVRELLNVFASRVQRIEMIEVGQCTKEMGGAIHLESNNEPPLACSFNFENLDQRPIPVLNTPDDILVDF